MSRLSHRRSVVRHLLPCNLILALRSMTPHQEQQGKLLSRPRVKSAELLRHGNRPHKILRMFPMLDKNLSRIGHNRVSTLRRLEWHRPVDRYESHLGPFQTQPVHSGRVSQVLLQDQIPVAPCHLPVPAGFHRGATRTASLWRPPLLQRTHKVV